MSDKQIREHIYMYSSEAQYLNLTPERAVGFQALADMQPLQRGETVEHPMMVKWLVEFLKELFTHNLEAHVWTLVLACRPRS